MITKHDMERICHLQREARPDFIRDLFNWDPDANNHMWERFETDQKNVIWFYMALPDAEKQMVLDFLNSDERYPVSTFKPKSEEDKSEFKSE